MKFRRSVKAVLVGVGLLLLTGVSLLYLGQISQAAPGSDQSIPVNSPSIGLAQAGGITLTKTLNKSSNVVRVGEILSFTIVLQNGAFTLTHIRLVDDYTEEVMGFISATPVSPTTHDPATGELIWSNLANPAAIAPGDTLTFTLFFRAEHPQTAIVNGVRTEAITATGTEVANKEATEQVEEAVGGSAPIVKFLSPPDSTPEAGQRVTFTHIITNNGAALLTYLPVTDTYNATYLDFLVAIPPANITSPPGTLVWTNLATTTSPYFGPIPADTSVVITTVFSATTQVLNTENRASTQGARDEFDNDLAGDSALVPITIIGEGPAPEDDSDDDDDEDDEDAPAPTATDTAVPRPTATPAMTLTPGVTGTSTPLYLPETGRLRTNRWGAVALLGLSLLTLGWYLFRIPKTKD